MQESVEEKLNKINGIKYNAELKGTTYTENIELNVGNKETLKTLFENRMIVSDNYNAEWISLEKSLEFMKSSGFEIERLK